MNVELGHVLYDDDRFNLMQALNNRGGLSEKQIKKRIKFHNFYRTLKVLKKYELIKRDKIDDRQLWVLTEKGRDLISFFGGK